MKEKTDVQTTTEDKPVEEKTAAEVKADEVTEEPNTAAASTDNNSLESENKALKEENETLKRELAFCKFNIKEECKNDVILLAEQLVNTENCDFLQAVETVVNKYPGFKASNITLNLGGSTQGAKVNVNKDAFTAGVKNNFLGGK